MKFQYALIKKLLVLSAFTFLLPASYSHAHSGSTGNAPWEACSAKPKSQACEYKGFHRERYIGTCQSISLHMMCVRNQPIIQPENKHETHAETKVKEVITAPKDAVQDSST
jgi:hypothetical protein